MKISIDLDLEDLGPALSKLLPASLTPTALRVTATQLRIDAKVSKLGVGVPVHLKAKLHHGPGSLRVEGFELEGAMGLAKMVLPSLQKGIAKVNEKLPPFHLKGEKGGEALDITWSK
jgi:hypothetical protein